jgi:hypothetical protein
MGLEAGDRIRFNYINWRGERGVRRAEVIRIYKGSTKYHPEVQYLMEAIDLDKKEIRVFALKDMTDIVHIR